MRQVFEAHLKRVEWDESRFPVRLRPFVMAESTLEGMPIAIASRIDAGETPHDLAADYGLSIEEIERAVLYERAA